MRYSPPPGRDAGPVPGPRGGRRPSALEDVASEGDDHRAIHRHADPLEDVEVQVGDPTLNAAFHHPADTSATGECGAGPATTLAHRTDLVADPDALFLVPPSRLDRELGASDAGHDRHMFIRGASSWVSCGGRPISAAGWAALDGRRTLGVHQRRQRGMRRGRAARTASATAEMNMWRAPDPRTGRGAAGASAVPDSGGLAALREPVLVVGLVDALVDVGLGQQQREAPGADRLLRDDAFADV